MAKPISISPTKEAIKLTQFWQKLGPNTYPLDISKLIEGVIGSPDFTDRLLTKIGRFDSFEGCLARTIGTNTWTILLNSSSGNSRRRRFTFAHELGHFMCHRSIQNRFEDTDKTLNDFTNSLEKEANEFASWLLMPANIIREEFGTMPWCTQYLSILAARFECSLQACAIRYVALSSRPIAFVVSRDGMTRWGCKSEAAPFLKSLRFGDDLPAESHARVFQVSGEENTAVQDWTNAWNDYQLSRESQYFDSTGNGYQYTCIEFDG